MNRQFEWFHGLLLALTAEDFRKSLEDLVSSWNFEGALALERFWPHALPEQQIKIAAELRKIPPNQGKMAVRLLCLWAYTAPRALKSEIITTLGHFRSTASLWRLWALYTHTVHDEKKMGVIAIFKSLQSGLFFSDAMAAFEGQGEAVREALLDWAESIPYLDEDSRLSLERALFSQLETRKVGEITAFWQRRSNLMIRHGLSLRRVFRDHLTGPVLDSVQSPTHGLPPDLSHALMAQPHRPKLRVDAPAFWALFSTTDHPLDFGAFDPAIREGAGAYLAQKLPGWAHATSLIPLHQTLDRLRVFDLAAVGPLVQALKGEGSAPYKQAILEHLLTWRLTPSAKEELHTIVHLLLSDTQHVRIFEILARILILHFGEVGMRNLIDAFERHNDREHTLSLLKGLLHGLREDGGMKHLSTAGLLQVHQIAGRIADILKAHRAKSDLLFDRWCRLVALLQISERQSDLLDFLASEGSTPASVSALITLDTIGTQSAARDRVVAATDTHRDSWEFLSQAWGDLADAGRGEVASWGDGVFRSALDIPELAPMALHVLAAHPLGFCRSKIAAAVGQGPLLARAWALVALEQFPAESFAPEILGVLETQPEPLLYDRAVHAYLPLCDEGMLKTVISHYVEIRGEPQSLQRLFNDLVHRPDLLESGLKELLTYRAHPRFGRFAPLRRFFLKAWDTQDLPLPLDAILDHSREGTPPASSGSRSVP